MTQNVVNDLLYVDDEGVQLFPNFISFDEKRAYSVEMNNDFSRNVFLKDIQDNRINRKVKGIDSFRAYRKIQILLLSIMNLRTDFYI